jgi:twin BRCT domain
VFLPCTLSSPGFPPPLRALTESITIGAQLSPKPGQPALDAGFFGEERQRIRRLAECAGARYSGDLVCGETTHLVCRSVAQARAGEKFRCADAWGIAAVSWRWLLDCAQRDALLPVQPYSEDALREDDKGAAGLRPFRH